MIDKEETRKEKINIHREVLIGKNIGETVNKNGFCHKRISESGMSLISKAFIGYNLSVQVDYEFPSSSQLKGCIYVLVNRDYVIVDIQ